MVNDDLIKPVEGLHNIAGMDPTKRRQHKKQQQKKKKKDQKKHDESFDELDDLLDEQDSNNAPYTKTKRTNNDDSGIDYCA